ncbi:prostaglandin D2 synthase b, tandem duplicate 1 [Trichomycterus rosablanca]|uniref:prostaglandin D2 synthase b, tandem duplicate 1 n=1 Tax=Trichomycterus rosablanca TaxID=2290929 RepID=UPI002F359BC1
MKAMLRFCTVLLVVMTAWAAVLPMKDFNPEEMKGKWYMIGFANNAEWFSKHKATMKTGVSIINPTADGDLDVSTTNLKDDGSCWRMDYLAKKTETPGRFTFYVERWNCDHDMRVVEAKSDEYAILHVIKTKGGKTYMVNMLYARNTDLRDDLKSKFKKFSLETGILPENILLLPPNGEC